jgi:trimeric autotransporter adhesin
MKYPVRVRREYLAALMGVTLLAFLLWGPHAIAWPFQDRHTPMRGTRHGQAVQRPVVGTRTTADASRTVPAAASASVDASGSLPGGTSISVAIATPADGALIASPPGDVPLTGTASVGMGVPVANTSLIYVLDVSESTNHPVGCGGDQNGDGHANFILDCEIAALKALNGQAVSAGTVDRVGLVVFASSGAKADVGPGAGNQPLTGPGTDADGVDGPDIAQVTSSAFSGTGGGGVSEFTTRSVGVQTNFQAAVQNACALVQQSTNPNNLVVFLSDGTATTGGNAPGSLPCSPKTATFQTFAIGSASSCTNTGGGRGSLAQIASATGGTCTLVRDIPDLPKVVPGVIAAQLTRLLLTVDGGAPTDISSSASPSLPRTDPVSVSYSTTVPGLAPGIHTLCVRAEGSDGGGTGSVTECHHVTVATISLAPPSATNELGTPGQTHTVTATVAAGADGGVAGVPVSFSILSGPNAGKTGAATTNSGGQAAFTYTAVQGLAGLGTDTIQACFTDSQGTKSCASATKSWGDVTPPQVACAPTTNPSGQNVPQAGNNPNSGQNPDGFYVLTAVDAVDPNPLITLADSGSSATFGPFRSGTKIKLTQAPGSTPNEKPGAGDIDFHITIKGDALVTATDASGNTSAPISCRVPPPPK